MKFILVLSVSALVILGVQAKNNNDKSIFGKSLTKRAVRKLQQRRSTARRNVGVAVKEIPEKRRLSDVTKARRQLPYNTIEPTLVPTQPADDAYTTGKGYSGKGGKGYGGKGYEGKGYEGKGYEGKGYEGKGYEGKGYGKGGMMGGGMMGGGMMGGGMMSGKGGKGGKGGNGGKGGIYPTYDDVPYLDDLLVDDHMVTDDCQMIAFDETFAMPGPTAFLAPDTTAGDNGTPELPGTVFITEQVNLLELDGETPILGSTVTGTCTRTTIGDNGGGVCQFVFIDDEGYSITVDGYLPGPLGGPLAITGGTGSMVGVFGQFDFFPIFSTTNVNATGDIFIDVIEYEVIADIAVTVCPP